MAKSKVCAITSINALGPFLKMFSCAPSLVFSFFNENLNMYVILAICLVSDPPALCIFYSPHVIIGSL